MSQGKVYHLEPIFHLLNQRYFAGKIGCKLEWGRVRAVRVRRVRQLGRYERRANRIVLNRVLDQPDVPVHVVEAVLHHEMCHAAVPPTRQRRRMLYHSPEFRAKEREYEHYEAARGWIKTSHKILFQPPKNHLLVFNALGFGGLKR